jgi:hypothetical protein
LRKELSLIPFNDRVSVCLTNPTLVDSPNPIDEAAEDSIGRDTSARQRMKENDEEMNQIQEEELDFKQAQLGSRIKDNSVHQSTSDQELIQEPDTDPPMDPAFARGSERHPDADNNATTGASHMPGAVGESDLSLQI